MSNSYISWLLIFVVVPIALFWLFFYKELIKYYKVFTRVIGMCVLFGTAWDFFAMKTHIWWWPASCCFLPRIGGLPLEELLFMSLFAIYIATVILSLRYVYLMHSNLKRRQH